MNLRGLVKKPVPRPTSGNSTDVLLTPLRPLSSPPLAILPPEGNNSDAYRIDDADGNRGSTPHYYFGADRIGEQVNQRGLRKPWLCGYPTNKYSSKHLPAKAFHGRWQTGKRNRSLLRHLGIFAALVTITAVPGAFYVAVGYESGYRPTYPITYNCADRYPIGILSSEFILEWGV
jgi:hypothetical protein